MNEHEASFRKQIRVVQAERGLKDKDLAKLVQVNPTYISRWYAGSMGVLTPMATKLLDTLGLELQLVRKGD